MDPSSHAREARILAWEGLRVCYNRCAIEKRAPAKPALSPAAAEKQLAGFIAKFSPEHQKLLRAVRKALRRRFPTANEIVYDNYNFFVVAYGSTERSSDCIVSMTGAANGVALFFLQGARLPDPAKILLGAGRQVRFLRLESAGTLAQPEVEALLAVAEARMKTPFSTTGRGKLIIRMVSAKQRPRRRS